MKVRQVQDQYREGQEPNIPHLNQVQVILVNQAQALPLGKQPAVILDKAELAQDMQDKLEPHMDSNQVQV